MISLDSINLPEDLWWADETDWTPVAQGTEYATTGSLMVDVSSKQAGQPITLVGDDQTAWVTRATVLALQELAADPGLEMTLVVHSRTFTAIFSHDGGKPIDAEPLVRISPPQDSDYYIIRALRFLALSETT